MLKAIKSAAWHAMRASGVFAAVLNSSWRKHRLLILCYHGIAQQDEHLWRPSLYMPRSVFQQRLDMLKRGRYNVLPLQEGLSLAKSGDLPPRSVVLTFDDGGVDFFRVAFPLLEEYGFPVTVYQSTYYSDHPWPVFNLMLSYLLWRRRGAVLTKGRQLGLADTMDLRTEESRSKIVVDLVVRAEDQGLTGAQKHKLTVTLARLLDIDYDELLASRLLQLMNLGEIEQLAAQGVDFQLHTHRHRTPVDEALFRKEIQDNRASLPTACGHAVHFCYPSGVHRQEFLGWLKAEDIVSATTCHSGLVNSATDPLLLPRLVDTPERSATGFEAWLTGVGSLVEFRKAADPVPPPAAGRASRAAVR